MDLASLPDELFNTIESIRYVALCVDANIALHQRPGIANASDASSDHYEELLVNPAVLLLTEQRGQVDCGGLEYVLIRYGNFFQFVQRLSGGHISVSLDPSDSVLADVERIRTVLSV